MSLDSETILNFKSNYLGTFRFFRINCPLYFVSGEVLSSAAGKFVLQTLAFSIYLKLNADKTIFEGCKGLGIQQLQYFNWLPCKNSSKIANSRFKILDSVTKLMTSGSFLCSETFKSFASSITIKQTACNFKANQGLSFSRFRIFIEICTTNEIFVAKFKTSQQPFYATPSSVCRGFARKLLGCCDNPYLFVTFVSAFYDRLMGDRLIEFCGFFSCFAFVFFP